MTDDQTAAIWAALVAFVEDVHAPQDQLTAEQWTAAEQAYNDIPDLNRSPEDHVIGIALAVMLGRLDPPDLSERDWRVAERLLVEFTARAEAMP